MPGENNLESGGRGERFRGIFLILSARNALTPFPANSETTMHDVRIRVIDDVKRFTRDMDEAANRQIPFALARALTRTAQDAQSDVRSDLPRRFTIRNTWVSRSIRITPATKAKPEAIVGSLEPFTAP